MTRLALVALLLSACDVTAAFRCDSNEDCRQRGAKGTCQTSVSHCTFADDTCSSGQRFSDSSGSYSDQCYMGGGSGMPDARPPFNGPDDCPAVFTDTLGSEDARYARLTVSSTASSFKNLLKQCSEALPGATHPVNAKSGTLLLALHQKYSVNFYIGLVQDPASTVKSAGWVNFDGSTFDDDFWSSDNPDDGGGTTGADAKGENFGEIVAGGVNDVNATKDVALICECDGVAVSPTVNAFLTALGVQ